MASLTQKVVRGLFDYKNGELIWAKTRHSRAISGNVAGCLDKSHGYKEVRIRYEKYYIHRLIWIYFNESIDEGLSIDHINHNTSDNRIENLRLVNHRENHRNQRLRKNNPSGVNGISFDKSRNKWMARIMVNGKNIVLGRFETIQEAISMRLFANSYYGFHDNHGGL